MDVALHPSGLDALGAQGLQELATPAADVHHGALALEETGVGLEALAYVVGAPAKAGLERRVRGVGGGLRGRGGHRRHRGARLERRAQRAHFLGDRPQPIAQGEQALEPSRQL